MTQVQLEPSNHSDFSSVPAFGYELIREILLPDILGRETEAILYWAGKGLARKYPLDTVSEIIQFFKEAGWGDLRLKADKKDELEFELSSDLIKQRFKENPDCHFQLEAGFLAAQIERQKEVVTEAYEHPKKRSSIVLFTVKWDKKDIME